MAEVDESKPRPTQQDWLEALHSHRKETGVPGYWDALEENCKQWADEVGVSPFWKAARDRSATWASEFRSGQGGDLLAEEGLPGFTGKTKERIHSKSYQASCEDVSSVWPASGAPVPKLSDLVRTRIQCRFVDGVEFLAGRLHELASSMDLKPEWNRRGSLQGYFAQHVYFKHSVFFRFGGGSQATTVTCEIQLATVMSTRVWDATHGIYEVWREKPENSDDWQWNPRDPRFLARQLGHMIHLADGILVQLRDAVRKSKGKEL